MSKPPFEFDTLALHAGQRPDAETGTRATPIYQSASFVFESAEAAAGLFNLERTGHVYSRLSNPTNAVLEERIAVLDQGVGAVAVASGQVMSAYNFTCYKDRQSLEKFKLVDYKPVYNFNSMQVAKKITFNPYTHDKFRAWTVFGEEEFITVNNKQVNINESSYVDIDDAYLVAIDKDGRMLGLT